MPHESFEYVFQLSNGRMLNESFVTKYDGDWKIKNFQLSSEESKTYIFLLLEKNRNRHLLVFLAVICFEITTEFSFNYDTIKPHFLVCLRFLFQY